MGRLVPFLYSVWEKTKNFQKNREVDCKMKLDT